jgi:ribosomal protein L11 methyltransferase
MHVLTINSLSLEQADRLTDELAFLLPEPLSLSMVEEPDEILWRVEAHFAEAPRDEDIRAIAGELPFRLEELVQRDWVVESLKGLAPVRAGRFYVHGGHDRDNIPAGVIPIEIEASVAFGTGHHGTTAGCLMALSDVLKRKVQYPALDLGCGSGVLAIAYALATRLPVLATDIDPIAVRETLSNARKNKAGPLVQARTANGLDHQSIRDGAPYGLILANILARPLEKLAPGLCAMLAADGEIILSGLTNAQERRVAAAYRMHGLCLARRIRLGGWSTLVLNRGA